MKKCCFCHLNFFPNLCKMHQAFRLDLVTVRAPLVKQKRTLCYVWYLATFAVAAALQRQARQLEQELRTGGRALGRVSLRGHERRQGLLVSSRDAASARRPQRRARQFWGHSHLLLFFTIWNVPCFISCVTVIVKKDELGSIGPKQIVRWLKSSRMKKYS